MHRTTNHSLRRRFLSRLGAGTVIGLSACWIVACNQVNSAQRLPFKALDVSGASYAQALSLPDTDGRIRSLTEFKGQVIFVFFGYVQCPDVCPTTMNDLAQAKLLLGSQGDRVQGIFVTLDPARDTAEVLRAYTQQFDPSLIALRGTAAQVAEAARSFKIVSEQIPGATPDTYTLNHTAAAYAFDPQGRVRLYIKYGTTPADMAHDFKLLLDDASPATASR